MGRYLPGYKDGGPVRTIKNLTDCLGDEYDIRILTNDRDHGDISSYSNIVYDSWNQIGKAKVWYVKPNGFKFKLIQELSKNIDVIYCCGPYNDYAIKLMLLNKFNMIRKKVVIASMGSFSKGALGIHSIRKSLFINMMKIFGLFKSILWSVTSLVEERELKEIIGQNAECMIAENLPRNIKIEHKRQKNQHELKIIFLSRICEKKNLLFAIQVLKKINKNVTFDIYGNIEDSVYWEKCKNELKNSLINWHYMGECDSEKAPETFGDYDVFLFPTFGENFGHVISESLLAGCIPVISNTTPWLDFDRYKCGKIVSLKDMNKFIDVINEFIEMDKEEFNTYVKNAQQYINSKNQESIKNTGYRRIFG